MYIESAIRKKLKISFILSVCSIVLAIIFLFIPIFTITNTAGMTEYKMSASAFDILIGNTKKEITVTAMGESVSEGTADFWEKLYLPSNLSSYSPESAESVKETISMFRVLIGIVCILTVIGAFFGALSRLCKYSTAEGVYIFRYTLLPTQMFKAVYSPFGCLTTFFVAQPLVSKTYGWTPDFILPLILNILLFALIIAAAIISGEPSKKLMVYGYAKMPVISFLFSDELRSGMEKREKKSLAQKYEIVTTDDKELFKLPEEDAQRINERMAPKYGDPYNFNPSTQNHRVGTVSSYEQNQSPTTPQYQQNNGYGTIQNQPQNIPQQTQMPPIIPQYQQTPHMYNQPPIAQPMHTAQQPLNPAVQQQNAAPQQQSNKFCPRCGTNLNSEATFCGKCGTKLN